MTVPTWKSGDMKWSRAARGKPAEHQSGSSSGKHECLSKCRRKEELHLIDAWTLSWGRCWAGEKAFFVISCSMWNENEAFLSLWQLLCWKVTLVQMKHFLFKERDGTLHDTEDLACWQVKVSDRPGELLTSATSCSASSASNCISPSKNVNWRSEGLCFFVCLFVCLFVFYFKSFLIQ